MATLSSLIEWVYHLLRGKVKASGTSGSNLLYDYPVREVLCMWCWSGSRTTVAGLVWYLRSTIETNRSCRVLMCHCRASPVQHVVKCFEMPLKAISEYLTHVFLFLFPETVNPFIFLFFETRKGGPSTAAGELGALHTILPKLRDPNSS